MCIFEANRSPQRLHSGGLAGFSRGLVELHAELGGPLEDVEELPERKIEQRGDHRDGVQDRQKAVEVAAQPFLRNRERQPGHRNREQQDDRQEIQRELLHGLRAPVAQAPPQRKRDAGEHQEAEMSRP